MLAILVIFARPLVSIFVGYDGDLVGMAVHGMRIYALIFITCGINIFVTGMFTALNNGVVSAVISFFRVLVFQGLCIAFLPMLFGVSGIWSSVVVAEVLSVMLTSGLLFGYRGRYRYGGIADMDKDKKQNE